MKKNDVKQLISNHLKQNESFVGCFVAMYRPSLWWSLLIGPFLFLGMKNYVVGISDQGMHIILLNFLGKPDQHNFLNFSEIRSFHSSKGFLQIPLKFEFKNGRILKIRAQRKGIDSIAKISEEILEYLRKKIP